MEKWIFYKATVTYNKNIRKMYTKADLAQDFISLEHFINTTNDNLTCDMVDSCMADWEDYQVWITNIKDNIMEVSFAYSDDLSNFVKGNVMKEMVHLINYISWRMFDPETDKYFIEFNRVSRLDYKNNIDAAAQIFGWSVLMPDTSDTINDINK